MHRPTLCRAIPFCAIRQNTRITLVNGRCYKISYCTVIIAIIINWLSLTVTHNMTSEIIMHSFSVTSANIAINDISLKSRFLALHFFVADSIDLSSTTLTKSAPKATEFVAEITQNQGHYVVQGHSRSPIVHPISHSSVTLTAFELLQIIGQIFAFDRGYTHTPTLAQGKPIYTRSRHLASRN